MAKLVLHIGAHKTGTSYLQSLFHHNREALERDGIHYPLIGPNMAHHALAAVWLEMPDIPAKFFRPGGPEALWQKFLADYANKSGTVFLSAENFSRIRPQQVDMADLARRLAVFDSVCIVYTMRAQVEMLPSLWLQVARSRRPLNLRRYVETALKDHLGGGIALDHARVYTQLLTGFRRDQITILDYGQFRETPGGIAQVFLNLLGSTLSADNLLPPPADEANISPDPLASYIAAQICPGISPPPGLIAKVASELHSRQLATASKSQGSKPAPTTLLSRREYRLIARSFARSNAKLAAWVQPVQPGFSFTSPSPPKGLIYREDISAQDIQRMAAKLRRPLQHTPFWQAANRLWRSIVNKSHF